MENKTLLAAFMSWSVVIFFCVFFIVLIKKDEQLSLKAPTIVDYTFLNLLLCKKLTCLSFQLKLKFYHIDDTFNKVHESARLIFHMS